MSSGRNSMLVEIPMAHSQIIKLTTKTGVSSRFRQSFCRDDTELEFLGFVDGYGLREGQPVACNSFIIGRTSLGGFENLDLW